MKTKPPVRKSKITHLTAVTPISSVLLSAYGHLSTWKAVGAEIGISGGMAYRVAVQGYEPHDPVIRRRIKKFAALDYDAWKARHMPALLAIVRWAEMPKAERR